MIDYPMTARLMATAVFLFVWARVSIKKNALEPIQWPIIIALLAAWGVQIAPELLSMGG